MHYFETKKITHICTKQCQCMCNFKAEKAKDTFIRKINEYCEMKPSQAMPSKAKQSKYNELTHSLTEKDRGGRKENKQKQNIK